MRHCSWKIAMLGLGLWALVPGCEQAPIPAGALPSIDAGQLAQIVQKHRGQVVLIDFWATWCDPCRQLFPHTVALHRQYAARGLSVITVSLDREGDERSVLK